MARALRIRVVTPAKVNLGLEVIGRRPDGYHEVVTLLQTVSLFDLFEWTETGEPFEYEGPMGVDPADDLVARVLETAPDRESWTGRLRLVKRIPLAAGLGGGSSDAAIALRLAFPSASPESFQERAAALGADVPFFLRGGTALATGAGTTLEWLDTPRLWLVLVTPPLMIPNKTRTMYAALRNEDFSDGATVRDVTRRLRDAPARVTPVPNTFTRALLDHPSMRYAYESLERAGGAVVSISGAGPTLYALSSNYVDAARLASRLRLAADPEIGEIRVARSVAGRRDDPSVIRLADAMRGRGVPH